MARKCGSKGVFSQRSSFLAGAGDVEAPGEARQDVFRELLPVDRGAVLGDVVEGVVNVGGGHRDVVPLHVRHGVVGGERFRRRLPRLSRLQVRERAAGVTADREVVARLEGARRRAEHGLHLGGDGEAEVVGLHVRALRRRQALLDVRGRRRCARRLRELALEEVLDVLGDLRHVGGGAEAHSGEVREDGVGVLDVHHARRDVGVVERVAEAHEAALEDGGVHDARRAADDRRKLHLIKDVALDVDAGGDLRQQQPVAHEGEDAALRDVFHDLALLARLVAAEGDFRDRLDELLHAALLQDDEAAVLRDVRLQPAGGERA
mmetsp:Transcript_10391/g.32205  ORF Transcript_10391/g.32205 Transcript_10391/m.32205 type:complete len:320 (+) Transcript_10391:93-1052(+)